MDDGNLVAATGLDMAIHGVVAGIQHTAGEPAIKRGLAVVQHPIPGLVPVDRLGGLPPETLGVGQRTLIDLFVSHDHLSSVSEK